MPTLILDQATGTVTLINGRLELTVETRPGYNPRSLTDLQSGRAFADSDYAWWDAEPAALLGAPGLTTRPDGTGTAVFTLKKGGLELTHTFTLPGDQADVLIEQITLRNPGPHPVDTSAFACGFAKVVHDGQDWLADVAVARLCEVPYRYHPETGARRDFTAPELLQSESWYSPVRSQMYRQRQSTAYGSEAWAWSGADTTLLLSKYNADAMEWSVMAKVKRHVRGDTTPKTLLRFGGAAGWKLGDPEGAAWLEPGASFTFGETRYCLLDGGWEAAFADFRGYMERQGHRLPEDYNPPVHWNELYDNPSGGGRGVPD